MVMNLALVITKQLNPSPLPHIQLLLIKNVLKTFVIGIDNTLSTIQIMSPSLKRRTQQLPVRTTDSFEST
ncbi:hypothetical protein Tco_0477146, partial [Tanacetum coccineum]